MKTSLVIQQIVMGLLLLVVGCSEQSRAPASTDSPLPDTWIELRRARPELRTYRNSILLDFEKSTDRVFATTAGTRPTIDTATAHTGFCSLHVMRAASVDIKLSSVMSGRELPGDWTLLGAYVLSNRDTPLQVQYLVDGQPLLTKTQSLSGGRWTPAMLDITSLPSQKLSMGQTVLLRLTPATPAELYIDDVMLIDNTETLVNDEPWSIQQVGHALTLEHTGRFRISLQADPATPDVWSLLEAGNLRAIVSQDQPRPLRWVIYRDGRRYANGNIDYLGHSEYAADYTAQHRSPAAIEIPEEQGRLERRSTGDANNDGYNELLGAYLINATKPRLEIRITPHTPQIVQPVFQIRGLPPGKIVATLEGQLIEQVDRLEDGTVLVIPPHHIQRPTTLNVRVQ